MTAAAVMLVATAGVVGVSGPASAGTLPFPTPASCTIQAFDTGRFVTAVGGGGRTTDVIHTDATVATAWETFTIVDAPAGHVGIRTVQGNYVTAVGGGGRTTDVIHTDATQIGAWEEFNLVPAPGRPADVFGIQTFDGHYLTAVGGGGRTTNVMRSNATQIGGWEEFRVTCIAASAVPFSTPASCTIQAFDTGRFVTAVDSGGRTTDVIHTDATVASAWETFTIADAGTGHIGIQAFDGHYLTAVGGGGRTTDVIHTNATQIGAWEEFNLVPAPGRPADVFGIQTFDGHYLTAVGGGGRTTDVIHTDATQIGGWEEFRLTCSAASAQYLVTGANTLADRDAIAGTGALIDAVDSNTVDITATSAQVASVQGLGFGVQAIPRPAPTPPQPGVNDFPPADSGYHNFDEMVAEINRVANAFPGLVAVYTIGTSFEGRALYAIKISDNVQVDEAEPEIVFDSHQHAREHITVEMALYLLNMFTSDYSTDGRVRDIVNSREIWILPDLNPDGGQYDLTNQTYQNWRKNRQPTPNSTAIGTDINRNYDAAWGCCGGSSDNPLDDQYRGPAPFSTPEAAAFRDFVNSRRIGGIQQIQANIDFHSYSELVLWPYGNSSNLLATMTADQKAVFQTIGQAMAATNGYTPEQSSQLYANSGSSIDWLWNTQHIWAFAFEMYPTPSGVGGFYPGDEVIAAQTARNRDAVLTLAEDADCPYRAINQQSTYCGFPIQSNLSGQCLQPSTAFHGDQIVQEPCNGTAQQGWESIPTGGNSFEFKNKVTGLCIHAEGAAPTNGGNIIQEPCSGFSNEKWDTVAGLPDINTSLTSLINGTHTFCLDVPSGFGQQFTPGLPMEQWTCTGGIAQKFSVGNFGVIIQA